MRISTRGRITIPKRFREWFGMHRNVEVEITPTREGLLIRKQTTTGHPVSRVVGILDRKALGTGISEDDYIEEIRGR